MGTACNWCSDVYQHLQNLNDKLQTLASSRVACPVLFIPVPKRHIKLGAGQENCSQFCMENGLHLRRDWEQDKVRGYRFKVSLGYNSRITALHFHTTAGSDLSYSEHGKGDFYLCQHTDACGLFSLRKQRCVNIRVWIQIDFKADLLIWLLHLAKWL